VGGQEVIVMASAGYSLLDLDELNLEFERRVWWDDGRISTSAISLVFEINKLHSPATALLT